MLCYVFVFVLLCNVLFLTPLSGSVLVERCHGQTAAGSVQQEEEEEGQEGKEGIWEKERQKEEMIRLYI